MLNAVSDADLRPAWLWKKASDLGIVDENWLRRSGAGRGVEKGIAQKITQWFSKIADVTDPRLLTPSRHITKSPPLRSAIKEAILSVVKRP